MTKRKRKARYVPPPRYLPSQAEIKAKCDEIRASWTERDFRCRAGLSKDPPPVETQEIPLSDFLPSRSEDRPQ